MKTQAECWQALLDGETLVKDDGVEVTLVDGYAKCDSYVWAFEIPENWSIKPKTKTITKEQLSTAMSMAPSFSLVWNNL